MVKVAIVCGAGIVSGKEIMALELVDGLKSRGVSIEVVTSSWGNGDLRRRLQGLEINMHVMRLGFISATLTRASVVMTAHQVLHWPGLLLNYGRFLRSSRPHKIVHTNWHHLLLLLPFLRPERDLYWLHEVIPNKPHYRKVFGWLERRLQCFVPVSYAAKASLLQIGTVESKIHVIHNGITDPAPFGDRPSLNSNYLIIGIVGQVGPWKGHDDLVEAFSQVVTSVLTAQLHIFGRGNPGYEEALKAKLASLGVSDRVVWRGFVTDRAEIYGSMDICVVPSRSEDPLPTVAIEAAFFGIPVIATRQGGLPEIVEDGVTGFLVAVGEPNALASRLKELLSDKSLRMRMGVRAKVRANEKFTRERFTGDFCRVLGIA